MSKKSLIIREIKRKKLSLKYYYIRIYLKKIISDKNISKYKKYQANLKLQSLPRNSSIVRQRRRCFITGRPRGVYRKFGLCSMKIRELAYKGEIPGLIKSSW